MEKLNNYIEIASFLKDEGLSLKYLDLNDRIENGSFLLPIIGQFSAGKSHFINNLLGIDVLPVKVTEATAYLTYIKYSDTPYVLLFDENNKAIEISLSGLKDIFESNIKQNNLNSILNISSDFKIAHIEVGVNHDLLKTGLVLVDTPGLNTINKDHEKITNDVFAKADYFIYVLRKSLTEQDIALIKNIQNLGTELIVVRTRIDEVNSSEESLEDVIIHEKNLIKEHLNVNEFYPVSNKNLEELTNEKLWRNLKNKINNTFEKEIKILLKTAIENKLNFDSSYLKSLLEQKKEYIVNNSSLTKEEIKSQQKIIEKELLILKHNNKVELSTLVLADDGISSIKKQKLKIKTQSENIFNTKIKGHYSLDKATEITNDIFEKQTEELNNLLDIEIQVISEKCKAVYQEKLKSIEGIKLSNKIEEIDFSISNIKESNNLIRLYKSKIEEAELDLLNNINESKQAKSNKNELQLSLNEESLEKEKKELELESHILSHETKYNTIKGIKISEGFKKAGALLDVATILIPTTAVVGVTKAVVGVSKFAKIPKVVKGLKNVKILAKGLDKVNELGKRVDVEAIKEDINQKSKELKAFRKEKKEELEKNGILDLVTLEYWFEKAGKFFDEPDKEVIDQKSEDEFNRKKKLIEKNAEDAKRKYLQKRYELEGAIKEEKKREIELTYSNKNKANLTLKILKLEEDLKAKQNIEITEDLMSQFAFRNENFLEKTLIEIENFLENIEIDYKQFINNNFEIKLKQYDVELKNRNLELEGLQNTEQESLSLIKKYTEFVNN